MFQRLSDRKWEWIANKPGNAEGRKERFKVLRNVTLQMRAATAVPEEETRRQLDNCDRRLAANAVLRRRDYSFCLYPEETLRPFCTQFL